MRQSKSSPEKVVDQFLAAPDSLRRNAKELEKARHRKAREEAERQRLLATKSKRAPSTEDLIADVVRVAEDPETNPFAKFRSVSRRRYELFGHYPVDVVDQRFGTFQHFKEVAGLADAAGTRLWRANRSKESRRAHAARYVERWVRPYVARAREFQRLGGRDYLLLSISDTHGPMLDPFVWLSFLSAIRDLRPDGVLFNGDTMDLNEISRHPKVPGRSEPLQSELDFQREMFRQVREDAGHQGDLLYTGGNHDVDRLAMYLTQVAPALSSLRDLRVDRLMGLADYGVRLLTGGTIASPAGTEDAKPGFLLFGHYRVHHGTMLGGDPAAKELRAAGRSGQSGHVHRASLAFGTTERDEALSWMTTPMGCRHEAGRDYVRGTNTGWQRGFGLARIFADGTVSQYPVVVSGRPERLTVEGTTYVRPKDLRDPEPHGNWLEELRLTNRRK